MKDRRISQSFLRSLRKVSLVRMLLDEWPLQVKFSDEKPRRVRRAVARMFKLWRNTGEWEVYKTYDQYRGGDILDIGAFHGFYSLHLAPKANIGDRFLSVEPDSNANQELSRNLGEASSIFRNVKFLCLSLPFGDGSQYAVKYLHESRAHPSFVKSNGSNDSAPLTIRGDAVLNALYMSPSLIKVDVEGAEGAVLRGLEGTLTKRRATLVLELHPFWQPEGESIQQIRTYLGSIGYQQICEEVDPFAIRTIWLPVADAGASRGN